MLSPWQSTELFCIMVYCVNKWTVVDSVHYLWQSILKGRVRQENDEANFTWFCSRLWNFAVILQVYCRERTYVANIKTHSTEDNVHEPSAAFTVPLTYLAPMFFVDADRITYCKIVFMADVWSEYDIYFVRWYSKCINFIVNYTDNVFEKLACCLTMENSVTKWYNYYN